MRMIASSSRFCRSPKRGVLVVVDGIDGDGRLRQPVGQRLLPRRELPEAFGFQLDEAGGTDAVHQRVGGVQARREQTSRTRRIYSYSNWVGR